MSNMYEIKNENKDSDVVDIYVYSNVEKSWWNEDYMDASKFQKALAEYPNASQINLYINSIGGSVMEGTAIYTQLKRHKAKVTAYVDGMACSIASVIAMAADEVVMGPLASLMIHNPWTWAAGNADQMRQIANQLDKIGVGIKKAYLEKCGDKITEEKLTEMLNAEEYITAEEAVEMGFADRIADESKMDAVEALAKATEGLDKSIPYVAMQIDKIQANIDKIGAAKKSAEEEKIENSKAHEIFMSYFKTKGE